MQSQQEAASASSIEPEPELGSTPESLRWGLGTRIGFRFSLAYLALYAFPFPLDSLPYGKFLATYWAALWDAIVPWIGEHVLHLQYKIAVSSNGSGDTTLGYVKILCFVVIAVAAATVWSFVDRRRPNYAQGYLWLRLYVRLLLGVTLLSYGAAKVIPTQMREPPLSVLLTTYGESAPMTLLWTFMGASKTYEIVSGLVEMLAGMLLFFPPCAVLGAVISMAVMTNVFLLNMSYDVPVKLLSFHLLIMSSFLLIPERKRLARFFLLNRGVKPQIVPAFFRRERLNKSLLSLQLLFGLYSAVASLDSSYQVAKSFGFLVPKPPLYGIWMVDEFSVDGSTSARPGAPGRWMRVIVDNNRVIVFQSVDGKWQRLIHQTDMQKKTITLWRRQSWIEKEKGQEIQVSFDRLPTDVITLDGIFDGKQIHAKLHHIPEPRFLLNSRGFHWINEYPFNGYDE